MLQNFINFTIVITDNCFIIFIKIKLSEFLCISFFFQLSIENLYNTNLRRIIYEHFEN